MKAYTAYIGLGANLGQPQDALSFACHAIHALNQTEIVKTSSLYRSAPVDAQGPDFYNAVVQIETQLTPQQLLLALQDIENQAGRERPYRNAPRTLDLDILLMFCQGQALHLQTENLQLPHPRWAERAFVLLPLQEIAAELVRPTQLLAVAGQRLVRL